MIFTRGFLSEFININDVSTQDIYKALNSLGLEVDSLEHYSPPKGVKVGRVLECVKHENSDKLSVCQVDIGTGETLQIVCGAKNVCSDIFVPVATIGTKIGDLEIKASELRGVKSQGMICSSTEIGLPKVNDGILKLDSSIGDFKIGDELGSLPFFNDDIFEIDITPNRGDCINIYGIAREIGAYFNLKMKNFEEPKEADNAMGIGRILQISHQGQLDSSYMFKACEVSDDELPLKISLRNAQNSLLSTNNGSNLANYITLVTGVIITPYHESETIKSGEDKKKIEIRKENGIDTVFGLKKLSSTGISVESMDHKSGLMFFEASYTPPNVVSQIAFEKKPKKTQEVFYRSSRGSNPNLKFGIDYLTKTLLETGFCKLYSGTHEVMQKPEKRSINVSAETISLAIGMEIQKQQIVNILKKLNFDVEVSGSGDSMVVGIPEFRHDIHTIQDITEEIVRVMGIDNIISIPTTLKEERKLGDGYEEFKKRSYFRKNAAGCGFNETIHFVFNHKEKLKKFGFETIDESIDISNPITGELNTLRPTLLLHLLESVQRNKNSGKGSISLFEIGSVYNKDRDESTKMAFIHSGAREKDSLNNCGKAKNYTFFEFAQKISDIIGSFEIKESEKIPNKLVHPYQYGDIFMCGVKAGVISKLHPDITEEYGIDDGYICEIDFEKIPFAKKIAKEYSKLPKSERDLSIVIEKSLPYSDIKNVIIATKQELVTRFYPVDIYEIPESENEISLTIRFELESKEKSLTEEEIHNVVTAIFENLNNKLKVKMR